jgi:hypothetical protein
MIQRFLFLVACAGLLLVAAPHAARADDLDKLMLLTFDHPVSLPRVTLPAGTYRFVLADADTEEDIVRVMSADGTVCYGTFLTIPENETHTPNSPVTLEKRRAGMAEAITAWFYPGDETGREFIYPDEERAGN